MKILSTGLKQNITDALAEGVIQLSPGILEKDIHVTDALNVIAGLSPSAEFILLRPEKDDRRPLKIQVGCTLVFAGGTCLSKAHGLIERMSEDIDIKVQLEPVPPGYGRKTNFSNRARLKELHKQIEERLCAQGFIATFSENTEQNKKDSARQINNPQIRDDHRYFHLSLDYQSVFQRELISLRAEIKVELIHRHTLLPATPLSFGYMLDNLLGRTSSINVTLPCISIAETLAEKVLAMLRRCAWKWYGGQEAEMDLALVRHIYDVGQIIKLIPDALPAACEIFPQLVETDAVEFGRQYPAFVTNPKTTLIQTLLRMETDEQLIKNYSERLLPLIYGKAAPDYVEAFRQFKFISEKLIARL